MAEAALCWRTVKSIDVVRLTMNTTFEAAGVGIDAACSPEEIKGGRWGRMLQAAQLARLAAKAKYPARFLRLASSPSDGGDLCGSG